jgi:CubicO group peptidase (beta-lactamase class C family)
MVAAAFIAASDTTRASQASQRASRPMLLATPDTVGMSGDKLQAVTALLRQFVADGKISGAVAAVARRGRLVYLEPVGLQSVETRTPMTERSLFRVYSMTKAVTAVAVMILVEEGKLRLDEPASKYLPEFKQATVQDSGTGTRRSPSREITIRDLLLHTSGLSHRTSDLYRQLKVRSRADALPQFITNITRAPLLEDPGTRFRYSEATTVLGRIVEIVSTTPFDAFVADRILKPLRMHDTTWWVDGEAQQRLASVYQRTKDGSLGPSEIEEVPFTRKPALIEGAVGLVSTATDFIRFGQMLLDKGVLDGARVLSAATVESITKNGLTDAMVQARGGAMGWGLANVDVVVGSGSRGYLTTIGEYGWDGSAGTFFAVDPSRDLVVTLMTQNLPANPDGLRQKFKAAVVAAVVE